MGLHHKQRVGTELKLMGKLEHWITSLISNKREWNNCFIKFIKLQNFEVRNMSEKSEKIRAKSKTKLMEMRCCVTPRGQTDVGSSQKAFLAF